MSLATERRKKELTLSSLCRFCLTSENCTNIYDRTKTQKAIALPLQIMSCLSVEVFPSDGMPTQICTKCKYFMELFYNFKTLCRNGDEAILEHIKDGSNLEPVTWPSKLNKIYKTENRQKKLEVKTIVGEDGAMMEVMASNEHFDSDDNEENVYNYKVEGDFNVTKDAACIKVLKTGETLQINKQDVMQNKQNNKVSDTRERPFECQVCNKKFLRLQYYQRHRRLKHQIDADQYDSKAEFCCELCPEIYLTQDELIYHSAQHATEDLTCPLCQEKFDNVEDVSEHIKGHVEGDEHMCDLCELMFTSQVKLDVHMAKKHPEEMAMDEGSEANSLETEDDEAINVKEEHDHMVVEIKKPTEFIKQDMQSDINSDGEIDLYGDSSMPPINSLAVLQTSTPQKPVQNKTIQPSQNSQTAAILRKAEEIKKKAQQQATEAKKNDKPEGRIAENKGTKGTADKALRLLEQELQDLKRTNLRNESQKPAAKFLKQAPKQNKRAAATATPAKNKPVEEKKPTPVQKVMSVDKKPTPDKIVTKENKEPKDSKEKTATPVAKQDKDKTSNQVNKSASKNGTSEDTPEDNPTRRSNRGSKVKDYAQMIKDRSHISSDDSDDGNDQDYKHSQADGRRKRGSVSKPAPKEVPTPTSVQEETPPTRKRGRPKKETKAAVPAKMIKSTNQEDNNNDGNNTTNPDKDTHTEQKSQDAAVNSQQSPSKDDETKPEPVILSPSGQALKPVPITCLPPGVKPLPLPLSLRSDQDTCNMQIGEKMVKVKKIVMTKAEVQEMAKKGLLEVKDGTVVLKPGIKLPKAETKTEVGAIKESQTTPTKSKPSRCELEEE